MPDRYTYTDTEVLVNRLGIRDAEQLARAEQAVAEIRLTELRTVSPVDGNFDFRHLQNIHRRLVGDLYDWAGEIRTVDTQAMGTGVPYCRPEFIGPFVQDVLAGIRDEDWLRGLDRDAFTDRLAHHWGELTAVHPFRDGNTRSQSAFFDQLSREAGYRIDWNALDLDRLKTARLIAVSKSPAELREALSPAIKTMAETGPHHRPEFEAPTPLTRPRNGKSSERSDGSEGKRLADLVRLNFPNRSAPIGNRAPEAGPTQSTGPGVEVQQPGSVPEPGLRQRKPKGPVVDAETLAAVRIASRAMPKPYAAGRTEDFGR